MLAGLSAMALLMAKLAAVLSDGSELLMPSALKKTPTMSPGASAEPTRNRS